MITEDGFLLDTECVLYSLIGIYCPRSDEGLQRSVSLDLKVLMLVGMKLLGKVYQLHEM